MHGSNELFLKSVFVKSRFRALDLHCCVSFVMSLSISGVKFICHSTLTQCMFCFDLTSQRIPTRTNACAIDWNDECYNHGSDEHTLSLSISYLSCSSQNTHKKKKNRNLGILGFHFICWVVGRHPCKSPLMPRITHSTPIWGNQLLQSQSTRKKQK